MTLCENMVILAISSYIIFDCKQNETNLKTMGTNFLSYLSCIGKLEEKRREVNEFCRFFFKFSFLFRINFPHTSN